MKNEINTSWRSFFFLMLLLLYSTHFLGYAPIAMLYTSIMVPMLPLIFLSFYFALSRYNNKNEYHKWLLFTMLALLGNIISARYYRGLSFFTAFSGQMLALYLFFFFIIDAIKPSVRQMIKCMKILGCVGLTLYYLQYILLPTPILESLTTGWRSHATESDIRRYEVTGEAIIYMFGLYSMNKYLLEFNKKYLIVVLLVIGMIFLHGYRGFLVAYLLANIFLFYNISFEISKIKFILYLLLFFVLIYYASYLPIFTTILNYMSEKNSVQSEFAVDELDRYIEFDFFYNYYLTSPYEWLFGSGFVGKEIYLGSNASYDYINWVDLGFFGMTFMGGVALVFCWIRLLLLNLRSIPKDYLFLGALSIYLISGSVVMTAAFSNGSAAIQAFAFYFFYKVREENNVGLEQL